MSVAGKRETQTDVAVGQRIREFRKAANLSQTQLADHIGVTFQQVQKYEKGTNRVGAGRLMHIARALNVPITAFFEGLTKPLHKQQSTTIRLAELRMIPAAAKLLGRSPRYQKWTLSI
jgi:transcriptional regulator with XRE-family HTH domain